MDSDALAKQKVECLQKELERLRKANEALNFALGVMSMKNLIISRETNTNSQVGVFLEGSDLNCNSNKRARADLQARAGLGAPSTTQTYVRTGFKDQALMAKDGYRWRKYGQKITKDNQYPRAYFNCSSRGCPVKKKVQRSLEDKSMVMVSYQDEHNHDVTLLLMFQLDHSCLGLLQLLSIVCCRHRATLLFLWYLSISISLSLFVEATKKIETTTYELNTRIGGENLKKHQN